MDVAFKADRAAAKVVARRLRADGYKPRIEKVSERAPDDPKRGPLGYLVRTGKFVTQAGADALRAKLSADGYTSARVVYTGEDGGRTTGPWVVHVLKVNPDRYNGTLAGVKPGGDLLLVAVDGRRPGYSVGASFPESAAIMDSLGAEEAVNLDGGGSTTVTVRQRLVNRPSDTTGERPIGDAVVLLR